MKTPSRPPMKLVDRTVLTLLAILITLGIVEYFFAPHYHPVFPWHHVPGYMALTGLIASIGLGALAKGAGVWLQRAEDADDRD